MGDPSFFDSNFHEIRGNNQQGHSNMTITFSPLDTSTLLGVFTHTEALPGYFRNLFVSTEVTSTDEYLDMEKIVKSRKIAPLVIPTAEGRPVYKDGVSMARFKVAYAKMKDAVDPTRVIKRRPSEILNPNPLTPMRVMTRSLATSPKSTATFSNAAMKSWWPML
jgi:hypothetical protein